LLRARGGYREKSKKHRGAESAVHKRSHSGHT
jgi:hypothetical protein